METPPLPHILVIDDLFGRTLRDRRNEERANLCAQYLLADVTGDEEGKGAAQRVRQPVARAVFHRGQRPACAAVEDWVENDLDAVLRVIERGWVQGDGEGPWSLVLLDLCFYTGRVTAASDAALPGTPQRRPDDDRPSNYFGLKVLAALQDRFPDLPVVILSSKPRRDVSERVSYLGALDFLPRGDAESAARLPEILHFHGLIPDDTGTILGRSKALLVALRAARRVAAGRRNVLIRGETGTGKELLAKYLHLHSSGGGGGRKLVCVDSGVLSPELYASELFGHVKGAFTGALRDRPGRIVQAAGGDLFLDEIGNMPLDVQAGLLRVLESRQVVPVGAGDGVAVEVRFLSATNEDIEARASTGGFRSDLLFRLREAGSVYLPPLRERREDIPLLVEQFIAQARQQNPRAMPRAATPQTLARLLEHDWPGNVRELRNVILSAVDDFPGVEHVVPGHLQIAGGRGTATAAGAAPPPAAADRRVGHATGRGAADEWLADLIARMEGFDPALLSPAALAGSLPRLQAAHGRLAAGLLRAALAATRRPTPGDPAGTLLIHPAVKLLTGDSKMSASAAASLIKKVLKLRPAQLQSLLDDPLLATALSTATRLRPSSRKPRPGAH